MKENQEVITIPRLSKKAKREWSLFLDPRTGRRDDFNRMIRASDRCRQLFPEAKAWAEILWKM
ncbi:MAG: hypothetical protein J6Q30_06585, partial [Oscillospiraceae bacterium]|nr:hypothetical protein [Oscillospiraceae bacterium]